MLAVFSLAILCTLFSLNQAGTGTDCSDLIVQPIEQLEPDYLVDLDTTFYRQFVNASGIPIIAPQDVAPYTLKEYARIIRGVTTDIKSEYQERALKKKLRIAVWASDTDACSIPEIFAVDDPCDFQNVAGTLVNNTMALAEPQDFACDGSGNAYAGRLLLEVYSYAVNYQLFDEDLEKRLLKAYKNALDNHLWNDQGALALPVQYFPLGPKSWFQGNDQGECGSTRCTADELKKIDPQLYDLVATIFNYPPTWTDQCDEICVPE